jgi:hypothetical protein
MDSHGSASYLSPVENGKYLTSESATDIIMLIDLATQQKRNEERKGRMTKEKLKKYKQ